MSFLNEPHRQRQKANARLVDLAEFTTQLSIYIYVMIRINTKDPENNMLTTYSIRTTRYIVLPVHIYKCDKYSSLKSIWNVFYIISQCQLRIYFLKNGLILSAWFRVPSNVCSICDGVCVCVCAFYVYYILLPSTVSRQITLGNSHHLW